MSTDDQKKPPQGPGYVFTLYCVHYHDDRADPNAGSGANYVRATFLHDLQLDFVSRPGADNVMIETPVRFIGISHAAISESPPAKVIPFYPLGKPEGAGGQAGRPRGGSSRPLSAFAGADNVQPASNNRATIQEDEKSPVAAHSDFADDVYDPIGVEANNGCQQKGVTCSCGPCRCCRGGRQTWRTTCSRLNAKCWARDAARYSGDATGNSWDATCWSAWDAAGSARDASRGARSRSPTGRTGNSTRRGGSSWCSAGGFRSTAADAPGRQQSAAVGNTACLISRFLSELSLHSLQRFTGSLTMSRSELAG